MQGQRSATGSLSDPINLDFGSPSSNVGVDQQIFWNNLGDSAESSLSEYRVMPRGADAYVSSASQEARHLSRWIGESGSSNSQNVINHDEQMAQIGWSSSISAARGVGPRRETQLYEPSTSRNVNLNLNINQIPSEPFFLRSSNDGALSRTYDSHVGGGSGDPMDCSNSSKSSGLEHRLFPSSSSSQAFASSSESSSFLVGEDGRRLSCKRKTIESNVGQSSNSGSFFSREASVWQAPGSSSSNISRQLEASASVGIPDSVNSRLELSMLGFSPDTLHTAAESSQRSHRLRVNPSNHRDSFLSRAIPAGHQQPIRLVPVNSPEVVLPSVNVASQGPVVHQQHPGLRRNAQGVRLGGAAPRSRTGTGQRDTRVHENLNSRNMSEHPMFVPSAHNLPSWHVGSSSRVGAGPGAQSTSAPSWGSSRRHSSAQHSRRLSEYVRRSLISPSGSEIGGHGGSSSSSVHRSVPSSSQEVGIPAGQNLPFSRSGYWMERHGDVGTGIPFSIRSSSAAVEGRSRLVSEHIRSVLDMMRRGEGLRFEDAMLLDPSILFGMADIHDQHREMRLDVDNMSYEELLALEDRIGSVCTGASAETIKTRMKQRKYVAVTRADQAEVEPCCICQEEYNKGDDLGTLDCGHDFHAECIKQWLGQKNLCPICKTTGLAS